MLRHAFSFLSVVLATLLVWGCSSRPSFVTKDEPWRAVEEEACLSARVVRETHFVQSRSGLGGPGVCGALRPFTVAGTHDGRVSFAPAAVLRCPMVPAVERWISGVVEPAAINYLGTPLAEIKVAASYACRPRNNQIGAMLSEHGHANALDVSAFVLADGRTLTVKSGWWGGERERGFLRAVHHGACSTFTTVLGPDADRFHHDHFHLDLARHGRDGRSKICQ